MAESTMAGVDSPSSAPVIEFIAMPRPIFDYRLENDPDNMNKKEFDRFEAERQKQVGNILRNHQQTSQATNGLCRRKPG